MSAPAQAPFPFFPPPFAIDTAGLGSQGPLLDLETAAGPAIGPDLPPYKKPRNSDALTLNPTQNPPFNPKMGPPMPPPPMNKAINKMFFKTRLCARFKLGTCPYGSNCNFAHGVEEVRKPPANWQEIVAAHEEDVGVGSRAEQHRISRLGICRKFYNGEGCPYGDRCNFLHEDPERVRDGMVNAGAAVTALSGTKGGALDHVESGGLVSSGGDGSWSSTKGILWKTRMCNKWETTGQCPFGDKCHFAHGSAELHKFTSLHMEVESGNAVVVPCKPLLSAGSIVSPRKVDSFCKLQAEDRKRFPRWKGHEKISGIYGDWIDDIRLPNKVQS